MGFSSRANQQNHQVPNKQDSGESTCSIRNGTHSLGLPTQLPISKEYLLNPLPKSNYIYNEEFFSMHCRGHSKRKKNALEISCRFKVK